MKISTQNIPGIVLVKKDGSPSEEGAAMLRRLNALIDRTGGILGEYLPVESRTVAQLQEIVPAGPAFGYCSNDAGGECAVYYAPTAAVWRRVDTNAPIS